MAWTIGLSRQLRHFGATKAASSGDQMGTGSKSNSPRTEQYMHICLAGVLLLFWGMITTISSRKAEVEGQKRRSAVSASKRHSLHDCSGQTNQCLLSRSNILARIQSNFSNTSARKIGQLWLSLKAGIRRRASTGSSLHMSGNSSLSYGTYLVDIHRLVANHTFSSLLCNTSRTSTPRARLRLTPDSIFLENGLGS